MNAFRGPEDVENAAWHIPPDDHDSGAGPRDHVPPVGEEAPGRERIKASPYSWRDPSTIPRRKWLYGVHLIRQFISVTVAPGGLGKSSLTIVEALALATGRPLLGETVHEPCRVWLWNGEDPIEELHRRVAAACQLYRISPAEIEGKLFLDSGRDMPMVVVKKVRDEILVTEPVVEDIIETIITNNIGAFVIDPFVLSHSVPENDNMAIDKTARQWARVADITNAAGHLIHHVRKGATGQSEFTVEDGRGAVALIAAARAARVMNRMTKEEGELAKIESHRRYFRIDDGKANLAPPADKTAWRYIESVPLANGDNVGVVTPWNWPDALGGITVQDLLNVQRAIDGKQLRESSQARDWAGNVIAMTLDLNPEADKRRINSMIKVWLTTGALRVANVVDDKGKNRPILEVGEWANT